VSSDHDPGEDRVGDQSVADEKEDVRESSAVTPLIREVIEKRVVGEHDSSDEGEPRSDD
jgi:hypothetical protein